MKILHLIDSFDARFDRDQVKLVELLEGKGYQNTVIASRYSSVWKPTKKEEFKSWEGRFRRTKIMHRPSLRIPTPFSKSLSAIYLPPRQVLCAYDITHAYTFGTYSSLLGAVLKATKGSRFIIRSDLSSVGYRKTAKASIYRMMLTYPFKIADAVYAYSKLEKDYLADLGVPESNIWVIPPGIDFGRFSGKSRPKERAGLTIGYLGRFCYVKGVHRIIPALQAILSEEKTVKVLFTGIAEDEGYAESVMRTLRRFSNFRYLGTLSTEPTRFYDICDIVLVPSIFETGAIAVLEAMASGNVVIASDINPISEYIEQGRTGFLFHDQNEVYLYLMKLVRRPSLISQIGEAARKKAKRYDWQTIIGRYEEMYRNVLDQERLEYPTSELM